MSSYDFYILLRSVDTLLARLMPLLIVIAVGASGLVLLRVWMKRGLPGRIDEQIADLEHRVAALEKRLPPSSR